MAKYILNWSQRKQTSTGKDKLDATLIGEDGTLHEHVTIWSDYPGFSTLMTGHTVEGTLTPARDPKYGPTLYPPRPAVSSYPPRGGMKTSGAVEAAKITEKSIDKAQGRKEDAIQKAGAQRDSVLMVTTFYAEKGFDDEDLKDKLEEWYRYFINLGNQPFV